MPRSSAGLIVRTQTGAGGTPFPPDPFHSHIAGAYLLGQSNREHIAGAYLLGQSNREHIAGAYLIIPSMVPGTPILSLISVDAETIFALTTPFSPPDVLPVMPHVETQWQVSRNVGFTDLAVDKISDEELIVGELDISAEAGLLFWVRARHIGAEEFVDDEGNINSIPRESDWSNVIALNLAQVPTTPTVSFGTITNTSAVINTSAYSDPLSRPHMSTVWEIQRTNGTPEYVLQLASTDDLVTFLATPLLNGQTFRARARHVNNIGLASGWSDWEAFQTDVGPPGKPWIEEVDEPTMGNYLIVSGPFQSGNLAPPQDAAHWQVATDDAFTMLVLDTGWDTTNLLTYPTTIFDENTLYYARVKHRDTDNEESEWSDAFEFSFEKRIYNFETEPLEEALPDWFVGMRDHWQGPWFGSIRTVPRQGFHDGRAFELNIQTNFSWVPAFTAISNENWYAHPRAEGPIIMAGAGRARTRMQLTEFHGQHMVSAGGPMQGGIIFNIGDFPYTNQAYRIWYAYGLFRISGMNIVIPGMAGEAAPLIPEGEFVTLDVRYFWTQRRWTAANPNPGVAIIGIIGPAPNIIATLVREKTGESWTIGRFASYPVQSSGGTIIGLPPPNYGEWGIFGQRTEGIKYFDYFSTARSGLPGAPGSIPSPIIRAPFAGQVALSTSTLEIAWVHPWQDSHPTLQYEGQRREGAGWVNLFAWQTARERVVQGAAFPPGPSNRIRVRARLGSGGTPSEWSESQDFTGTINATGRGFTNFAGTVSGEELDMFPVIEGGPYEILGNSFTEPVATANRLAVINSTQGTRRAQELFRGTAGVMQMKAQSYAVGREFGFMVLARNDTRPGREHLLGEYYIVRFSQEGNGAPDEAGSRERRLLIQKRRQSGSSGFVTDTLVDVNTESYFSYGSGTFYHFLADVDQDIITGDYMLRAKFWREGSPVPDIWNAEFNLTLHGDSGEEGIFGFYSIGGGPSYAYASTRGVGIDTIAWDERLFPYGVPERSKLLEKAWAFELDGHVFYVLNSVLGQSLIYDVVTQQWFRWYTRDVFYWNMFAGIVWKKRTIAADVLENKVWELDPYSELDEEEFFISRLVTGFLPIRGKESFRQGSARLTASMGKPSNTGAVVRLRYSDDGGHTWSDFHEIAMEDNNYVQRLKFRSLGRMRAPGRIWEVYDVGGLMRIDDLDSTQE